VLNIEESQARLTDEAALARLITSIPLPHSVRALLRKPFLGRRWDCVHQCDHWLASDGRIVVCVKVSGASASVIARMRTRFDDRRIVTPGLIPSRKLLLALLEVIAKEDGGSRRASAT
jgi:hypothetical protein